MKILIVALWLCVAICESRGRLHRYHNVYHKISQEKDLTTFYELLQTSRSTKVAILYTELTVFAPTNAAFEKYCGNVTNETMMYHLMYGAKMIRELSSGRNPSILERAPPFWVMRSSEGVFVNNAKIIKDQSDFMAKNRLDENGRNQVLHIIDEVLDPNVVNKNTTALDLLEDYSNWGLKPYTIEKFQRKVKQLHMKDVYNNSGKYTFFIPIDKNGYDIKYEMLDYFAVQNHVIPNNVLFTRSAPRYLFSTLADTYLRFSIFEKDGIFYARRKINRGETGHQQEEVIAEIVKPNIPLQNGVAHLISTPLTMMEKLKVKFPYLPMEHKLSTDPNLNITYQFAVKTGLIKLLKTGPPIYTFFLPSDKAWKHIEEFIDLDNLLEDDFVKSLDEILRGHIVMSSQSYSIDYLEKHSVNGSKLRLSTTNRPLYVNVYKHDGQYYIQWKNKHIKVSRPDYECTNGVIHIIDDVFLTKDELINEYEIKVERHQFLMSLLSILKALRI